MPKGLQGFQKGHPNFGKPPIGKHWKQSKKTINKRIKSRKKSGWVKNKKEWKNKLSESHKGQIPWNKGKKGITKFSFKTRKKISKTHKKLVKMGKCHLWKGGICPKNLAIRKSLEFKLWRESVFARDNWTCQKYKIRGIRLATHHIQNFSQFPELRFVIDNGITLSDKAHREFHKRFGVKNNNYSQIIKFLNFNGK